MFMLIKMKKKIKCSVKLWNYEKILKKITSGKNV